MPTLALAPERTGNFAVPEPMLTPADMIQRSLDLMPLVAEHSAEAESLGRYPEVVHEAFQKAGLYRVTQPRKFGGYQFDIETFYKIIINIARGCPATAWCYAFATGHTMEVAAFFNEETQAEIYGPDGDFRAPYYGGTPGIGTKVDGGYRVKGKFPFCSGSPYSTHMVGQFAVSDEEAERTGRPARMFLLDRANYTILDDWRGNQFGLSATGSNTIEVDAFVPDDQVIDRTMLDVQVDGGTIGSALHDHAEYALPLIGYMCGYYTCCVVGAAYAGLDTFEQDIRTRKMPVNPSELKETGKKSGSAEAEKEVSTPFRYQDESYQRNYGRALAGIQAAESIILNSARRAKEFSALNLKTGKYPAGFDAEQLALAQTSAKLARDTFDYNLWRMVGAPATRPGTRMNRLQRDLSVMGNHNALGFAEFTWVALGKAKLGVA